jgi:hypothetical protein
MGNWHPINLLQSDNENAYLRNQVEALEGQV